MSWDSAVLGLVLALSVHQQAQAQEPTVVLTSTPGQWVEATGSRKFGPDISENAACRYAEREARANALREVTGETVSNQDMLLCSERSESQSCELNQITWSQTEGLITQIADLKQSVSEESGFRECTVSLRANVQAPPGQRDPNFFASVSLNQQIFRPGEQLELGVDPSAPMHVYVFQWLPYRDGDGSVVRLFPNNFDRDELFERADVIPRRGGYRMTLSFPEEDIREDRLADEFLIVIGSKEPISFAESYGLDSFRQHLVTLPKDQTTISRRAYAITRVN